MSDDRTLHACDVNWRWAQTAFLASSVRGEVAEGRDAFLSHCGFPAPEFNLAHLKAPVRDLGRALEACAAFYAARGLPYAVVLRADRAGGCAAELLRRGYSPGAPTPGMLLEPIRIREPDSELEIEPVETPSQLEDFQRTAFEGFGLPAALAPEFLTQAFLDLPGVALYTGRVAAEPVCTSALVVTPGVAGIYWVATRPGWRGHGFGEAVTWAAVAGGLAAGCRVASLQASDMGRPVYQRMGFEAPLSYLRFDPPAGL